MLVSPTTAAGSRGTPLEELRRQIAAVESGPSAEDAGAVSTGVPALDALLPRGGLRRGAVTDWLSAAAGGGAQTLALLAAREACREGKSLVVVDRQRRFYPPAAAAWGIDLSRLIVVHPANEADELWAIDQALRCRGIAAVWARREELESRDFRRLQLAAESGGTLGLLVRSARARGQPSWADVQLVCSPLAPRTVGRPFQAVQDGPEGPSYTSGWRLHVELTRCRGSHPGQSVELEIDEWTGQIQTRSVSEGNARHETHPLRPSAQLVAAAAGCLVAV
jgi:hypothetical protein